MPILKNYQNYSKRKSSLYNLNIIKANQTDFKNVRVSLVRNFSIFYKTDDNKVIIVGIWDNRRNPEDLWQNLES